MILYFRKSIIIFFAILILANRCGATITAMSPSPNYLIVFVHGIISNKDAFGGDNGLKKYLEDKLGLQGYVYSFAYNFSDNKVSIINQARELGNATYINPSWTGDMPSLSDSSFWQNEKDWSKIYNGHSWISQSING